VIVKQYPQSLCIRINELAIFTCRAKCECSGVNGYWVINGNDAYSPQQRSSFQQMGFTFSYDRERENGNISYNYIWTLTVNATKAVNNTYVHCVFENNNVTDRSLNATLQIIAG
jgi:hypothetical protein